MKENKETSKKLWPWLVAFGMALVVSADLFAPVRKTSAFTVVFCSALSGLILFFTFFKQKEMPKHCKVMLVFASLMPWYPIVLPWRQISLLIQLVIVHLLAGEIFYLAALKKKKYTVLMNVTCLFYLCLIGSVDNYTFVESTNGLRFWKINLIAGVLVTAVFVWSVFTNRTKMAFENNSSKCLSVLITFVLVFLMSYCVTHHLNYALDTGEPVAYRMEIVDKDIITSVGRRHRPTKYVLVLNTGEENIKMNVARDFYNGKEIGDYMDVLLYEGFLGDAFYIQY